MTPLPAARSMGGSISPRDRKKPVLMLGGRRSFVAAWPSRAACEVCGAGATTGYVGPVVGQIFHPGPADHYVCEPCARHEAGLEPGELTGHACGRKCTDDLHVEVRLEEYAFTDLSPEAQLSKIQQEFAERGWRVRSVEAVHGPPTLGGHPWRITFEPARAT